MNDCEVCKRRPRGICAYHKKEIANQLKLRKIREEVIQLLGGKCDCCSESHKEFLRIMVRGHSDKNKKNKIHLYRQILKDFGSRRYTLKCYNCSMSIFHRRYCPHQKEKE